jgi:glutamyl-tRNA(Gln) amidotransferase subunit D
MLRGFIMRDNKAISVRNPARVKEMMLTPISCDITEREPFDGYLIMQGGVPEVEEFIGRLKL